jgi:hypothetical protein
MSEGRRILLGENPLNPESGQIRGEMVELEGERYYRISHYDRMAPFFMTLVSDSDHWMFLSSRGGLSCGRINPENALFPYYTDDKIHDASTYSGPLTILLIEAEKRTYLWEPFQMLSPDVYRVQRNLYKNGTGNRLIFEAINQTLQVCFRYAWQNSDRYGFVRQSLLSNLSDKEIRVELVDGIRNILPYGVNRMLQSNMSTLVDGYKKCELHSTTGLGIYTLSSILTDRAEPSEALKATTVWSAGLEHPRYLLSEDQADAFRKGMVPESETILKGRRGAYLVYDAIPLHPGEIREWIIVAEINQDPSDVPALIRELESADVIKAVMEDVERGTRQLGHLVGLADGIQCSGNAMKSARHFSNTLFNIMRGGIFPEGYGVRLRDFLDFMEKWNQPVFLRHHASLSALSDESIRYHDLLAFSEKQDDPDLVRLVSEYLPLTFSRRHGDPSRPWNSFSIDVKNEKGDLNFNYQGNWRDIFQNWEALALSFPGFIESFITKFVNASTMDGYNPYRITRDGFDWEVLDPSDPWSNIGYWGDHQVIYLVKLLELSRKFHPGTIRELLTTDRFVYANIPYRIKPYGSIVKDPQDTILYDDELAGVIAERVNKTGSDGKLVYRDGEIYRVELAEKLLVNLLAKLSNFIPGGGIWMNTQRPEWNDANNALVGNGLSMVTLYYLRRYVGELITLFTTGDETFLLTDTLHSYFREVFSILEKFRDRTDRGFSDRERREFIDAIGTAGSGYRDKIYAGRFGDRRVELTSGDLLSFLNLCKDYMEHSIRTSRREDKLFHAYNLVEFGEGRCRVRYLHEMLEGQVAVISSGSLSPGEVLEVMDALRSSRMYRPDQRSFILYPDRDLPGFLEKNLLGREFIRKSGFLAGELASGNRRIVEQDVEGDVHFNGSFRNVNDLRKALDRVEGLEDAEKELVCTAFIETFQHRQFTGRSGTFFKYEGLGSIYWHMVSKLLLAVQEVCIKAAENGTDRRILQRLKAHRSQIEEGIGATKSPDEYGAFPMDPYSHTPGFAGVQQPGMTGQVKEDILNRFGQLGIRVENGSIRFDPDLLPEEAYLAAPEKWALPDRTIQLERGQLGFSFCGVPIIYLKGGEDLITVMYSKGEPGTYPGLILPKDLSGQIFNRSGIVLQIVVTLSTKY